MFLVVFCIFFFKQKTAYEMRISDWSSDVCSSYLLLACRYPLVLAGMGGVARAELVLAVTRGGGFGFLGMVREPVALIRAEIERIRAHSDRRFGVNLIPEIGRAHV